MDDIQVIDCGLYESLGFDGMGLPTGAKFDPDSIPRDFKVVCRFAVLA